MDERLEVPRSVLRLALSAIEDAEHELGEPEIAELVSLRLDQKLERARLTLQEVLGE